MEDKIIVFQQNVYGSSFSITEPSANVPIGSECKGHAFHSKRTCLKPGTKVCKVFDDGVAIIQLDNVTYCQDPKDMVLWSGIRLSVNDLSSEEIQYLESRG